MKKICMLLSALIITVCGCNTITVDNGLTGEISQPQNPTSPGADEAVDLGLSVKWAPYNIGAIKATDYGNYYAYGETAPKNTYSQSNYTSPTSLNNVGNIIYTTNDVATTAWGQNWRMPSKEEIDELSSKCKWTEEVVDGVKGCRIKGPNGNSIFLPASGVYYNDKQYDVNINGYYRHGSTDSLTCKYFNIPVNGIYGCSVRPVLSLEAEQNSTIQVPDVSEAIDMCLSVKWAPYNIGATNANEYGNYYAYGETQHKGVYNTKNYNTNNEINPDSSIVYTTQDVATQLWNDDWRMPTADEVIELMRFCEIENTPQGLYAKAKNGNRLFLPAAGYTDEYTRYYKDQEGYYRNGSSESVSQSYFNFKGRPHTGGTVRPVLTLKGEQKGEISVPHPESAIDLGLSVKWAPYNVGATNTYEFGYLYAFGETEPKSRYTEENYTAPTEFNKDNTIYGTVHDVATQKWGKEWRLPTNEEVEELLSVCKINIIDEGLYAIAPNGNTMFLPAAGYSSGFKREKGTLGGYYRTASPTDKDFVYFNIEGKDYIGASIRPVLHDPYVQEEVISVPDKSAAIDLGLSVNWAPYNVGASNPCETGNYYAYGETEVKEMYKTENYTEITGAISGTSSDVAVVKWGNGWRMPTEEEILELWQRCSWKEIEKNGVWGISVTAMNGNTIFLPNTGYIRGFGIVNQKLNGYYLNGSCNSLNIKGFSIPENFVGAVVRPVIDKDPANVTIGESILDISFSNYSNTDYRRIIMNGEYYNDIYMESDVSITMKDYFIDNEITDYGIQLYKNNEFIAEISAFSKEQYDFSDIEQTPKRSLTNNPTDKFRLKLCCNNYDFHCFNIDGKYIANIGKTHSYKPYMVKKDHNGIEVKTVMEIMYPFSMEYARQPEMKITLNNYSFEDWGDRHNFNSHITCETNGALFMDTVNIHIAFCDIKDLNDASTISISEIKEIGKAWVHDGWIGYIRNILFDKSNDLRYVILYYEAITNYGNEKIPVRSNPLILDFRNGNCNLIFKDEWTGWPDRVNFNFQQ